MSEQPYVWVVEIKFSERGPWQPVVGIGLTRKGADRVRAEWQRNNTGNAFRVTQYRRPSP